MSRFSRKQIVVLSVAALAIAAIAIAAISVCCSHHTYSRELVVADSLCESNPPKAISHLKALRVKSKSMRTADSWYYRLLCVKARDKAYIPAPDINEPQTIVNHYESFGADKSKLQYAYYYLGCAYRDLDNIPMALEFYKKALTIVADKNSKFASAVNFQTGFQLLEQSFYKEAMNYFRESLRIETMHHNSAMMAYCLQKIAYVYQEEKNDSCFLYYKAALDIAQKSNDMQVCNEMKSSLANYYVEKAEYEKAKDLSLPVIHTMSDDNNAKDSFYDVAGLSYLGLGRLDSALYFFNELNKTEKIKTKVESSRQLAHIYNIKGDSKRSLMYMAEYEQAADSLKKINVESSIAKMNALYNYNLREKENTRLKFEAKEKSFLFVFVAMALALLCALMFYQRERGKKNYMRIKFMHEHLEQLYKSSCRQYEVSLDLKDKEIAGLMKKIDHQNGGSIEDKEKMRVYDMLRNRIRTNQKLTDKMWEDILLIIDRVYPGLRVKLMGAYGLDKEEFKISVLVKLDLLNMEIATLVCKTPGAVTQKRAAIYKKIFKEKGSSKDFDIYIKSL